mgnify:CR=1 FL=1
MPSFFYIKIQTKSPPERQLFRRPEGLSFFKEKLFYSSFNAS